MTVYPASIADTTDRIHSWSPNGDIITLVTTHSEPMQIHLDKIKPAVDSLFSSLATILISLLPSQMMEQLPPEPQWESKDNLTATIPFVDQDEFLSMISPLYTKFNASMRSPEESCHQIWSGNTLQVDKLEKWLDLEQQALQKIFLILLFTGGGVSPRTFTIAALQYRDPPGKRNLYLHHQVLCFAWPKAKANSQSGNNSSDSLYSYPPQLNWLLFIYLGVVRRFTIDVVKGLKWSLGEMERTLFVNTGMKTTRGHSWKTPLMNNILGKFGEDIFNSNPRVADLRQLTQSVYSLHFCGRKEMEEIMEAAANKMGNHTKGVSKRWYGRDNWTLGGFEFFFACSQAWHCWLGLIPYDSSITLYLGELPILQRRRNQGVANLRASLWIRDHGRVVPAITSIRDLLSRLLPKVSSNTPTPYESLTPVTRGNLNITYFVKPLHLYSGVEKAHHLECVPQ